MTEARDTFGGFWKYQEEMDKLEQWPGLNARWAEVKLDGTFHPIKGVLKKDDSSKETQTTIRSSATPTRRSVSFHPGKASGGSDGEPVKKLPPWKP